MTGCMQGPVYMRHVCVDFLLEAAWGYLSVGLLFFFPWGCCYGVSLGLHCTSLLTVLLCWIDCCFGCWVLLGTYCLLPVTHMHGP